MTAKDQGCAVRVVVAPGATNAGGAQLACTDATVNII